MPKAALPKWKVNWLQSDLASTNTEKKYIYIIRKIAMRTVRADYCDHGYCKQLLIVIIFQKSPFTEVFYIENFQLLLYLSVYVNLF